MASVKVAVRVRPFNQREKDMGAKPIIQMEGKKTRIFNNKNSEQSKDFTFDHSYWSFDHADPHFASQEQVFGDLGKDVVDAAFEGYNACVFAYGQTGSGKTFTMTGSPDNQGLIPRICSSLFGRMASGASYRTEVSYLEIYNERVRDLLRDGSGHNLRVRQDPRCGVYVSDLSKHLVSEYAHIQELMARGNSVRTTASTNMNDTSSRSHAIFTLQFIQAGFSNDMPSETVSKVHLVDLAGSERADATGATGQRLKEGAHINKSLVTLGSVISALAELSSPDASRKSAFIPYRDSVLTWLLKDSLGGNSKTIMIAAISPADCNYSETLSTLRYANRAKNIINKPTINEDPNVKLIKELRDEITKLRGLLGTEVTLENPQVLAALHKKEAQEKVLTENWAEKWRETQKILREQQALGLRKAGTGVVLDSDMPHLIGIDDNLLSTGVTLYHLKDGETVIGSEEADQKPDIVLSGVDVDQQHCSIVLTQGVATLVPNLSSQCWVNGCLVDKPTRLSQGCQILLGRTNMFRYNDPVEAEKLRKEGCPSTNQLSLSRLSLLSWSHTDLSTSASASQSSENLRDSCELLEKSGRLQMQTAELLKEKEAFKLEQAEKEQDWEREQQKKREALEIAQKQLEQERQQMEQVYEEQCKRLAADWQLLEKHQASNMAALRHREAELDKSRRLLQCERDEEIAAITIERSAMDEVKKCIDTKKKEFKEFVARKVQEVLSLNNNYLSSDDKIKPLSVLAAEKFCEGLCWLDLTVPTSPFFTPDSAPSPSWATLTATLKEGVVGEIINHHKTAITKLETELKNRAKCVAEREKKIKNLEIQLSENSEQSSVKECESDKPTTEPVSPERTEPPGDITQRKQMLTLDLVPAADVESSPDTFHTALSPSPSPSPPAPTIMSDSGVGLNPRSGDSNSGDSSTDEVSSCDSIYRHGYRLKLMYNKMKLNDKQCVEESLTKSMKQLMQKITRQRLHIIRSLEADLDNIDTDQEINVSDMCKTLQDLKREYVRLEKKMEQRGKENMSCEESDDASTSAEESTSLCGTVKYGSSKHVTHSHSHGHNPMFVSAQDFSPICRSSQDIVHHRLLQDRMQSPLSPIMNLSVSQSQFIDHLPPFNTFMARSMPSLNPAHSWSAELHEGLAVKIPTYVLRGAGSSTHFAYEVRLTANGDCWAVLRRYSRFRELHLHMKQKYGQKVGLLNLPPRRLFHRQAEWLAKERRPQLERYLQSLLELLSTIPASPIFNNTTKAALLQLSPFFRRGVFESSKYGTS